MLLLPVVHTTTVIVLQFTLLPSPLFPLESLLPLPHHIFLDSSPHPLTNKTCIQETSRSGPWKKVNGTGKNVWKQLAARFREWRKKINKHSTISPFSNHSNWPSHPFPLVLSLYRALLISYSFFSAACPHWPSYPSRPADGELGIHLPSGWATESEKVNYCWIQRRCK